MSSTLTKFIEKTIYIYNTIYISYENIHHGKYDVDIFS
jgi:hypothetical protein